MSVAGPAEQGRGLVDGAPSPEDAGERPRRTPGEVVKDIVLFSAAPFITMAWIATFPFIAVSQLRQLWRERKTAS